MILCHDFAFCCIDFHTPSSTSLLQFICRDLEVFKFEQNVKIKLSPLNIILFIQCLLLTEFKCYYEEFASLDIFDWCKCAIDVTPFYIFASSTVITAVSLRRTLRCPWATRPSLALRWLSPSSALTSLTAHMSCVLRR